MFKILHVLIIFVFLVSCATPVAIINTYDGLDSVQLCANYKHGVEEDLQKQMDIGLDHFIVMHNSAETAIKVKGCRNRDDSQTINFTFEPAKYVNGKNNLAATAGNILGIIALPVGMAAAGSEYFIGFYFWPDTQTNMRINLSDDLTGVAGPELPFILKTPGYFNSIRKQNIKQGRGFNQTLHFWFDSAEKQHARKQKQQAKL